MVFETVSGSSAIEQRPGFLRLLDKLEPDDVLIVTKMNRRGLNAIDVAGTVQRLSGMGVQVHCLALGGMGLTSSAGKMTMGVIDAVAQFERDLFIERTQSGLMRAKAEGAVPGRPATLRAERGCQLNNAKVERSENGWRPGIRRRWFEWPEAYYDGFAFSVSRTKSSRNWRSTKARCCRVATTVTVNTRAPIGNSTVTNHISADACGGPNTSRAKNTTRNPPPKSTKPPIQMAINVLASRCIDKRQLIWVSPARPVISAVRRVCANGVV